MKNYYNQFFEKVEERNVEITLVQRKKRSITIRCKFKDKLEISSGKKLSKIEALEFFYEKKEWIMKSFAKIDKGRLEKINLIFNLNKLETEKRINDLVLPIFKQECERMNIELPTLKFRKMVSRWGVCYPTKKVIVLNLFLLLTNEKCIKYIVIHELAHFLEASHNKRFKSILSYYYPNYKEVEKSLKTYNLRGTDE